LIVVDTSVWVAYLNGVLSRQTDILDGLLGERRVLMGDIILCEILQGVRDERSARRVVARLALLPCAEMAGRESAVAAAENYRALRGRGITVRKTIDLLIGTFCLEHGHELLHADRDFAPMAAHLALRVL
jgi:predicted nucleic acid-binding protein